MFAWIYWSGYVVSFLFVFVATVITMRRKVANEEISSSQVIDEYAGAILMAFLTSFLSWVWFVLYLGLVIIGTGKKIDPPTTARAR